MTIRGAFRALRFYGFWTLSFVMVPFASTSLLAQTGATYYVSTKGSDSNPGTLAEPWLTVQHAANTVTAGATVYVLSLIHIFGLGRGLDACPDSSVGFGFHAPRFSLSAAVSAPSKKAFRSSPKAAADLYRRPALGASAFPITAFNAAGQLDGSARGGRPD